ncbi:hypothetical protein BDDG_12416 [Blastomyces dermatitidis ATCC 18188]|uniref:Uncharacterized protein n=1 Tax=Ajellomyces dermatitidis (strain ATCC 18188 / CBS 674.68) TaxID=653446 RepID=A0A0J9ERU5_AJEDA|nr:hypothetical protein BDDG_12416 [Blastomyces dermatitidis ATCC 18188]
MCCGCTVNTVFIGYHLSAAGKLEDTRLSQCSGRGSLRAPSQIAPHPWGMDRASGRTRLPRHSTTRFCARSHIRSVAGRRQRQTDACTITFPIQHTGYIYRCAAVQLFRSVFNTISPSSPVTYQSCTPRDYYGRKSNKAFPSRYNG